MRLYSLGGLETSIIFVCGAHVADSGPPPGWTA